MSKSKDTFKQVELKYCERCGGLWLRPKGSRRVYCASCWPAMAELPAPRRRQGDARLPAAPGEFDMEGAVIDGWVALAEVQP
jgi:hypothetical protein